MHEAQISKPETEVCGCKTDTILDSKQNVIASTTRTETNGILEKSGKECGRKIEI